MRSLDSFGIYAAGKFAANQKMTSVATRSICKYKTFFVYIKIFPSGKIADKAMWRSVFLTIWHGMLNADSTKTP